MRHVLKLIKDYTLATVAGALKAFLVFLYEDKLRKALLGGP